MSLRSDGWQKSAEGRSFSVLNEGEETSGKKYFEAMIKKWKVKIVKNFKFLQNSLNFLKK
jgi:hypothetical protein